MIRATIAPFPPYSLRDSASGSWDGTRRFRDGVLELAFDAGGPARAAVRQRADGALGVALDAADADAALAHLRFLLAVDDDHRPFLERARTDPLLRPSVDRRPGLRPARVSTLVHALVRAIAGQLIAAPHARRIERQVVRLAGEPAGDLRLPPTAAGMRRVSPAQLERCGLSPARAVALAHVGRRDPERLRRVPCETALAHLGRERGIGPWSCGVVALYGLGTYGHGLVGDLGLVKLATALFGRDATVADTRALVEPYGAWAGLASLHLMAHPLASTAAARIARHRRRPLAAR